MEGMNQSPIVNRSCSPTVKVNNPAPTPGGSSIQAPCNDYASGVTVNTEAGVAKAAVKSDAKFPMATLPSGGTL